MIRCPHCEEHIEAERLPPNRKYRNEFGMDVFGCPECGQSFRFEPSEYLVVRERLERGEVPEGVAIEAVDELLPSEQSAIDYDRAAETRLSRAIGQKSERYFGVGLVALVTYIVSLFTPGWVQWIAGFFIAGALIGEFSMVGALRSFQQFRGRADRVLRNHYRLTVIALALLIYALLGLWSGWPAVWLALLVGTFIIALHGVSYGPRESRD